MRASEFELRPTTKKAAKYNLIERATRAYNRAAQYWYEGNVPEKERIGGAAIWQGRNVVLFDNKGEIKAEYRWYPKGNRLRQMF